jgi:hypothetical protein
MKRDWIDAEIDTAMKRGERKFMTEPRALRARYDSRSGRVSVELSNGCTFVFPARALQGLDSATDAELARIEPTPLGFGLHWPLLDADFTVSGLLMGIFGSRAWMAKEMARRAGSATSPAKAAAARRNGRKGGRPKSARRKRAA